jgi:hypothetical protein
MIDNPLTPPVAKLLGDKKKWTFIETRNAPRFIMIKENSFCRIAATSFFYSFLEIRIKWNNGIIKPLKPLCKGNEGKKIRFNNYENWKGLQQGLILSIFA